MTKKILIYSNQQQHSKEIEQQLKRAIEARDVRLVDATETPDYIVTIGGDGTLLAAFHEYQSLIPQVCFVGIHTGHLGFYADWQGHELDELVSSIEVSNGEHVSYPLLEVQIHYQDGRQEQKLAVNEFSMRTVAGTMVSDVVIKDRFFETFRGDGLCVATPTGSTGLNKSLGGAVMHPRVDALQLTEMASLNNRVYRTLSAPIIIPKDEYFVLKPHCHGEIVMMLDHLVLPTEPVASINLCIAAQRIKFAKFRHTHFWDRVENSFIGSKQQEKSHQSGEGK